MNNKNHSLWYIASDLEDIASTLELSHTAMYAALEELEDLANDPVYCCLKSTHAILYLVADRLFSEREHLKQLYKEIYKLHGADVLEDPAHFAEDTEEEEQEPAEDPARHEQQKNIQKALEQLSAAEITALFEQRAQQQPGSAR